MSDSMPCLSNVSHTYESILKLLRHVLAYTECSSGDHFGPWRPIGGIPQDHKVQEAYNEVGGFGDQRMF